MKKLFNIFVILLVCFIAIDVNAANYYWVGGTGSWTDLTHWATTSGGSTKHTLLPTLTDDVFFDANSFSAAGQIVTVTDGATFRSMDWTGATNSPTITCSFLAQVNVYGSLILPATVLRNFSGEFRFKATSGNHNVNLGNLPLRSPDNEVLYFEGVGGTWTLTGGVSQYGISFTAGTLNTNGQSVACSVFGTSGSLSQTLNLGNSNITVGTWNITGTNITINAGTSTITSTSIFNGRNLTYNNLIINGTVSVNGSNTFNTITLNASSILRLKEGTTQTITNVVSNGTVANPVTIKSVTDGAAATLSKASGSVSINYVRIQDNIATGGATFSAPVGSTDLGNVTGWNITPITPTVQTSALTRSKVLPTAVELRWTNGNGARRIVLAKATTAVNSPPVDLTAYTAGAFGLGTQIGTGNYVVYSGNADRATITGLTANTVYHFAVYEFNGTGTAARFLTTSPAIISATTLPANAVIISNAPVSVCAGKYYDSGGDGLYNYSNNESFTQTLTPLTAGNKLRLTFVDFFTSGPGDVLSIYDGANTSAPLLGSFSQSAVPGTITATNAAGTLTIRFVSDASIQSTGWDATISCVTLDTEPTVAASGLNFSGVTSSSLTLSWANGNGAKRIVLARQGSAVNFVPVDGTDYAANPSFGTGTNLSTGNFVLYNGSGTTVNISNLSVNTTYFFSVYEYNGANTSSNYRTSGTTANRTTLNVAAEPTVAASAITIIGRSESIVNFNWTNGNGAQRLVVMKQGSPVNALPVDGNVYSAGSLLGSGNTVFYSGSANNAFISGLATNTTYHFAVFEFNGTGVGTTNYLTTNPATVSTSTLVAPPTVNPALSVASQFFTSIKFQWSGGDAEKYLLVLSTGTPVINNLDGAEYTPSSVFGAGSSVGTGAFVVYARSGNTVEVTGLQPNTQYVARIAGYNGSGNLTNYYSVSGPSFTSTLRYKPTVQASNVIITNVATDSMRVSWQRGNGDYSMLVVKAVDPISLSIRDSTEVFIISNRYVSYGFGTDLGNGHLGVYAGSSNSVSIKNLAPNTKYHVAVYTYNSVYVSSVAKFFSYFLTSGAPTASATTLAGKNYYWVGGTGKWSDYARHWATASGGSTFHASMPSQSDNVYFDGASFATDKDTVYVDQEITSRNMDWTAITKKVSFSTMASNRCAMVDIYGSLKLSDLMNIETGGFDFLSTEKGNVIHLANKTLAFNRCSENVHFRGYGGEWTLTGNLTIQRLYLYQGKLIATNSVFNVGSQIDFWSSQLELGNTTIYTSNLEWGNAKAEINGGNFVINSYNNLLISPKEARFKKVAIKGNFYNTVKFMGKITFDSLLLDPGREIQFQSGNTFTIDKFILNGDSTKTTYLRSTTPGSAAIFSKATGSVNINYVILQDNVAQGGAQFNANNSVNNGNVTGWNITTPGVLTPKRSATSISFRRVFRDNLKMKWTKGDGMKRIVIAKENTAVDKFPSNGSFYAANRTFGSGANLGSGNFVVYDGISDTTTVTGLTAGKKYHFAVVEYNTWSGGIKYKISGPAIANVATVGTNDVVFSNTPVSVCNVKFFDEGGNGFYTEDQNITQTITPATAGTKLGVLFTYFEMPAFDSLIVYNGATTAAPVLGKFRSTTKPTQPMIATNPSGALTFRLKGNNSSETEESFKGWMAELFCVGTLIAEPGTQTSALSVTAKTESSLTVKSTKGSGAGRMIIAKEASPVTRLPIDGTSFAANATFGEGTHLGDGNYIVYAGAEETVTVNGLKGDTRYHFTSVEFNGTEGSTNYLLTTPPTVKDSTLVAPPSVASSDLVFLGVGISRLVTSFLPGNGKNRIIVIRKWKEVLFTPTDGIFYTATGVGQQPVADSTYVVANGNWSGSNVFNLEQSTRYYIKIFEYNGTGTRTRYLTSSTLSGSVTTKGPVVTMKKIKDTYCPNAVVEVPFVISSPFAANNKFKLQLSNDAGGFGTPTNLRDTLITATSGIIKAKIPNTVGGGNGYKLRIVSSAPITVSDSIRTVSIPIVPDVTITLDGSTFVSSITSGIQWLRNGVPISGATAPTQNFTDGGVYTVKATIGECYKTSEPIVIIGLEDTGGEWSIYPNPVQDELSIVRGSASGIASYRVYDLQGREIVQGNLSDEKTKLDVKNFPQGIFLVKVISGRSISIKKFVKR
jgi:hypothetical protein